MNLELNSTNINTILVNLSCCITTLSRQLLLFSQLGNKKCFEDARNKILLVSRIYDILKQNYGTNYPTSCFTTDELKDLYQQALNICKLCNCTK